MEFSYLIGISIFFRVRPPLPAMHHSRFKHFLLSYVRWMNARNATLPICPNIGTVDRDCDIDRKTATSERNIEKCSSITFYISSFVFLPRVSSINFTCKTVRGRVLSHAFQEYRAVIFYTILLCRVRVVLSVRVSFIQSPLTLKKETII